MTPEATRFLDKARQVPGQGEQMLGIDLSEPAGRSAYLAAFHAAQALIFERTRRAVRTHRSVHAQFARLLRDQARDGDDLRVFLSRAYELKSAADYGVDAHSELSREDARQALATAERFIMDDERRLAEPSP